MPSFAAQSRRGEAWREQVVKIDGQVELCKLYLHDRFNEADERIPRLLLTSDYRLMVGLPVGST